MQNLEESEILGAVECDDHGRVISVTFKWPTDRTRISRRVIRNTLASGIHKHGDKLYLSAFPMVIVDEDADTYTVERPGPLVYNRESIFHKDAIVVMAARE